MSRETLVTASPNIDHDKEQDEAPLDSNDLAVLEDFAKEDRGTARQLALEQAGRPGRTIDVIDKSGNTVRVSVMNIGKDIGSAAVSPFPRHEASKQKAEYIDPAYEQAREDSWR